MLMKSNLNDTSMFVDKFIYILALFVLKKAAHYCWIVVNSIISMITIDNIDYQLCVHRLINGQSNTTIFFWFFVG